jgi:hypothetical protein
MPHSEQKSNKPELKIGPFAGGIGVNVWINEVGSATAPSQIRSVTISPRRYQDSETNEWKDSPSFRPIDLPALILALQKAHEHITTTPLPGQPFEAQESEGGNDDTPY